MKKSSYSIHEKKIPVIETERLLLRPFTLEDLESYAAMHREEAFVRHIGCGLLSKEQVWGNIAFIIGHWALRGYGIWAAELKQTGELMGRIGLLYPDGWPGVELCWALAPAYWGNGYAAEGAVGAKDWAFANTQLQELVSIIGKENHKSIALAERIGCSLDSEIDFKGVAAYLYKTKK